MIKFRSSMSITVLVICVGSFSYMVLPGSRMVITEMVCPQQQISVRQSKGNSAPVLVKHSTKARPSEAYNGLHEYSKQKFTYLQNGSQLFHCHTRESLLVSDRGRLGNHLNFYITLLLIQKRTKTRAVVTEGVHRSLSRFLDEVLLWPVSEECFKTFQNRKEATFMFHEGREYIRKVKNRTSDPIRIWVTDYALSLDGNLQASNKEETLKLLTMKSVLRTKVESYFEGKGVLIGMHIRRTDYIDRLKATCKENVILTEDWYVQAYKTIVPMTNATNTTLIVSSDDPDWCKSHLPSSINPSFVSDYHSSLDKQIYPAAFDLAVLASCNAVIIDNGSFGRWASYYSGGLTAYPIYNCTGKRTYGLGKRKHIHNWIGVPVSSN